MSTSRARNSAVTTAKPIAISSAITVIATSTRTWPSGIPGDTQCQNPAAATSTPLIMSSRPIISITIDCWDSAPNSPTQNSAAASSRNASSVTVVPPRCVASTTVAIMVARIAIPITIMTSIFAPMIDSPSANAGSGGGRPARSGHGIAKIPAASAANRTPETASAPRLLCSIDIGISPAGFIMYMTMKTAITSISMIIMRITSTPR